MSIFAGLSLKEIYVKRCKEVGCKPNSSLRNALSDKPDDFDSLSFIDVSKNFLGPKGILPLIDVVRCAQKIHTLDFREQQLTNEVVKKLCHALVRHQGITRINMSNNPITIAAGTYILELVIQNSNIEYIGLDNTVVRQAVLEKVNTMTAKNSEKKLRRKTLLSDTFDKSLSAKVEKPQKRVSLLDLKNTLSTFLHDKHEFLFQDNPLDALSQLCMSQSAWFFDVQFPADDSALHMEITKRYNVSRWKRLNEIYPKVKLFPNKQSESDRSLYEPNIVLPTDIHPGFSWLCTSIVSAFPTMPQLETLIHAPDFFGATAFGVYVVRVHVDGEWHYVFIDDFVPVDSEDVPIFTPPVQHGGAAFIWPCLLEKAVAKLHGGYQALDSHHDTEKDVLPPGPAKAAKETLLRNQGKPTSCAVTMADFTGGIPIRRCIHGNKEHGEFDSSEWWEILLELIGKGKNSVAVVRSRGAGDVLPGIEEHHTYQLVQTLQVNGVRLVELVNHCPHDPTSGWRGDWSEVSNLWSDFPDVEDYVLGLRGASGKRRTTAPMSETAAHDETKKPFASNFMLNHSTISKPTFWMAYATFLQAFEQIHLCRLFPSTYMERKVDGEWNYLSSGGSIECPTWYRNPHYHLQIYRRTFFFINLSLPDSRFTERENEAIGFDLLQDNYFPLSASETERTNKILFSTRHRHGGVISFEGMLAPSDVYWFVPSCEEVGAFSSFTVRLFSEGSFSMTKEVMEDYYNMIHTSADVPASGPFKFGEGNAQITLVVGSSRFLQPSGSGVTPTDAQPNDDEESMSRLSARARSSATGRSQTLLDGGDDKAEHRLVIRACCNPRANSRTPTNKSVALFLNEGVSILSDDGETTYGRSLGPLDKKLYAESPHVFGNTVYLTHSPVMTYDTFTVTCCPQPEGSAASVELTAWVSTPLQLKSFALPFWKKTLFPVEWLEGSCSYYETSIIQPQLEIFPQESYERMVIRMDLVESSIPSPALMLIVLANGQLGEPIRGRIPKEHVVSQSEYTSERWVQCEVDIQIEDEVESLLIIPCLQPVGTKGKCIITVLREEEVKGRVLNQR